MKSQKTRVFVVLYLFGLKDSLIQFSYINNADAHGHHSAEIDSAISGINQLSKVRIPHDMMLLVVVKIS